MISADKIRTWADRTLGRPGRLDLAVALLLGGYAFARLYATSGLPAALGVLGMTLPVAWRRPRPVAAAAVLAVAAPLNAVLFGPLVRCGTALPAVFLVAYSVGARSDRLRYAAAGLLLCLANVAAQCWSDPRLGFPTVALMAPAVLAFFVSGCLVRRRAAMTEELRRTSMRLREQRERMARLAVRAERARIAGDLNTSLLNSIAEIAATAAAAGAAADTDEARARQLLAAIEHEGRATLQRMRDVLGSWQDDSPGRPQPSLAELSELLNRSAASRTQLTVHGTPQTLPAALELSGYRIVEHMLTAMPDVPGGTVAVTVRFDPAALELRVDGPSGPRTAVPLAAARDRASLHGGTVDTRVSAGRLRATARLPLVTSHG